MSLDLSRFEIVGVHDYERAELDAVLASTATTLFGVHGFPDTKSKTITIKRTTTRETPMYAADTSNELIILTAGENRPWQFAYQLSHEFGHLAARADLRHPRIDGNHWVEEMLCECYSLIALDAMAREPSAVQSGAVSYFNALNEEHRDAVVDEEWFQAALPELTASKTLTPKAMKIARYIFDRTKPDTIIRDNNLVATVPVGLSIHKHLKHWHALSQNEVSVAKWISEICRDESRKSEALPRQDTSVA
ncbi:MAG: hypothetical protein IKE42_28915 [Aquamicrobium sp.]|uniref:hypothetical protein n=1 Tax=Mesorhizobium sp. Pch-S TaxID=2082387 RepID=UPI00101357AB|nr:hypothetical protein [Mesorhizobium sp. Pch-S]MBR2691897.1 hypothetical protein [Aquamicrobium sp.]